MDPSRIDVRLARRLVDGQFPQWSSLPLSPVWPQGVDNRTFRLGAELSVRLPAGDRYALQVSKEQRWLPTLAPQLPLRIPEPQAEGSPAYGYPYPWSVYRWITGTPASESVKDWSSIVLPLARFLASLRRVDPSDGPKPGAHNFFRGGPLSVYDAETAIAITALGGEIDRTAVEKVWTSATATRWAADPQWFHGDVAPANLLTRDGELAAVIDFGSSGVGDPACDTVIAWTHLDYPNRAIFRRTIGVDDDTWARGRGWALWKALITLVAQLEKNDDGGAAQSRAVISAAIDDSG